MQLRLPLTFLAILSLIPNLSACSSSEDGDGEEEVGDTTEGTGESESTSDESGSDDQGEQGSGETAMSDTEATESTDETDLGDTEETATETETTGDPGLNEQLCMDGCAVFAECLGGGRIPNCYEDCLENHNAMEGECLGNYQALTSCIIGLTCDELDQFLDEEPEPFPCQEELENICQEEPCTVGVGQGRNPDECSIDYSCPDEPVYSVDCDGNGCSCMIDGAEVATCDQALEVCGGLEDLMAINECCGWDL